MITFSYNEDYQMITARTDSPYSDYLYLEGGKHKRGNLYLYPLNDINIDKLFKHHKEKEGGGNVWKQSLKEAMLKEIRKNISDRTSGKLLSVLTIENIKKYPLLAKTNGLKPFANQHISQYYGRYCENHAMLWEMGPLDGNTLIITDKGIMRLKEYKNELVANPEGVHSSNGLIEKRCKELITVETYFGQSISGTPEHEILTTEGTKTFAELTSESELLIGFPNVFSNEIPFSFSFARALGMMVAEGNCNQPQIEFNYEGNEDLIENIRAELTPQGETTRTVGYKTTWRAWWSTAKVRKSKGNSFPIKYSENGHKIIPKEVLCACKDIQINFLYGYFRGDGSIRKSNDNLSFKLTERDEELVNCVQLMLFNMGIITKKYKYKEVNAFNLTAGNDETNKMIALGLLDGKQNTKEPNFGFYGKAGNGNNGKRYKFVGDLLVTKIVSIKREPKDQKVYCLSMNNTNHWFYGNGIVVHNTGKTRAAIDVYEIKKKKKEVTNGLVVCPLSMLYKWCDQIEAWSGNTNVCPLTGTKEEKKEILSLGFEWYVVTYETLERYKDDFNFVDDKWFIILDETTKIKNPKAKRTKACFELGLKTKHKLILTGTPVTQNAYDVFSQFRFLDNGKTFGFSYDEFINKYFFKNGYKLILKRDASKEISDLMFGKSTRFLKKDCLDIPEKLYDTRILDMPSENRARYDEMLRYAITEIEGSEKVTAPIILTQLLRLSQITSGFVKDVVNTEVAFEVNPKLNALAEILEEAEGKVIVWSRFKYDVANILKLCEKMGIKAVSIYGEDNAIRRTENVRLFQEDVDTKVIVGTASTGGHGIDLVAAKTVVYYSNSYSLEQRLQSEDRAHRAGQINQVQYIDLLCKDTIDVSIYKILRNKKNIADMITKDNLREILVS